MKIIDTHTHLTDERYGAARYEIIEDLTNNNIGAIIDVGYDLRSSKGAVELANKYPFIYAAIGTHPHDSKDFKEVDFGTYLELAKNSKVVAIGEIGLDYHYDNSPRDIQKKVFIRQLELANQAGLPVIVHTRDAEEDTLKILDEQAHLINNGLLIHCFSGNRDFARECISRGYYLSFGGAITYKNNQNAYDVITAIGLERVMIETDCPYLTPVPHRGKLNEPKYVNYVAEKIAGWLGLSKQEVADITTANALELFTKIDGDILK